MIKFRGLITAPSRRYVVKGATVLLAGIASPAVLRVGPALAAFPDRPVKLVVPNSPGGISDIVARLLAVSLQQEMGGSFAIENKGGAGGNIGMGGVARSDPDGYTLLITTSAFAVNPGLITVCLSIPCRISSLSPSWRHRPTFLR